jgi:hypothetical protein
MESMKDVSKKYTVDYVLDEATRTRAEELYKDFYQRTIAKDANHVEDEITPHVIFRVAVLIASKQAVYQVASSSAGR